MLSRKFCRHFTVSIVVFWPKRVPPVHVLLCIDKSEIHSQMHDFLPPPSSNSRLLGGMAYRYESGELHETQIVIDPKDGENTVIAHNLFSM